MTTTEKIACLTIVIGLLVAGLMDECDAQLAEQPHIADASNMVQPQLLRPAP